MSAQTENSSNSKFGGNIMFTVDNTLGLNQIQQMQSMNSNALQMNNANTALQNLSKAMGNLDTPKSGIGGMILSAAVGIGIAAIGMGLSFLLGPEMEAAALGVDAVLMGAEVGGEAAVEVGVDVAAEAATELATNAAEDATTDVISKGIKEGSDEILTGKGSRTNGSLKAESKTSVFADGSSETETTITNSKNTGYSKTITENVSADGEYTRDVTGSTSFSQKVKNKIKKSAKGIGIAGSIATGVGVMGLGTGIDKGVTSASSAEFTKQSNDLNTKSSQVQNVIGEINTRLSQNEQSMQGAQQVIQSTFQIASQIYNITPSAA